MQTTLFAPRPGRVDLAPGAALLRGFAQDRVSVDEITSIAVIAPFRHMSTPGGAAMSAAMTNAGPWGWVSDAAGYRYADRDPASNLPWPPIPAAWSALAAAAAAALGFPNFAPDAVLINRYAPAARMGQHRDLDEEALHEPIVTVSLGLPAIFLFGGLSRKDPVTRVEVAHGDVVVWGGPARLAYHGVDPVAAGHHPAAGPFRYSLTFRRARRLP